MNGSEFSFTSSTEAPAVDVFAANTGLSKSRVKQAMTAGAAWITRGNRQERLRRAKAVIQDGTRLALYYDEEILSTVPPEPELIGDGETYSVWHKPAGLMASGTRFGDHCAINRVVEKKWQRPVFLVHRLDRFAWGLMVLAHSKRSAAGLSSQFQARTVTKRYMALLDGVLEEVQQYDQPLDGKPALTEAIPLGHNATQTLAAISIETGRKHQIRRHLAEAGYPIVGDRSYGRADTRGLQLASVSLSFDCPNEGKRVSFDLPTALHPRLDDPDPS